VYAGAWTPRLNGCCLCVPGALSWQSAGYQRVRRKKKLKQHYEELDVNDPEAVKAAAAFKADRASSLRVIVDARVEPKEATAAEIADAAYKDATAMVDSEDEQIQQLAQRATANFVGTERKNIMARARALRGAVRRWVAGDRRRFLPAPLLLLCCCCCCCCLPDLSVHGAAWAGLLCLCGACSGHEVEEGVALFDVVPSMIGYQPAQLD
jgi:hypothetical protein